MGTLYIIGNGLDLHFGLETRTDHFKEYLKAQSVYNEISNALDVLNCHGVDWHEYEQSLNDIDLDEIELQNETQPDYLSERESDRDGGIINMQMYVDSLSDAINAALKEMVVNANNAARAKGATTAKRSLFENGDAILSFNYTSTVEYLFFVPDHVPIFHIHGCLEQGSPLIFGYKSNMNSYNNAWATIDEENWDYYIAQQREVVYSFYEGWRKHLQTEQLREFLAGCSGIDKVVVLGHSMSDVDAEYMEEIESKLRPLCWEVSYHRKDDIVKVHTQEYSFDRKIRFAPIQGLMEK